MKILKTFDKMDVDHGTSKMENTPIPRSRLGQLPVELIDMVAKCIESYDFCNLRLTCKEIEFNSRTLFMREYFERKRVSLLPHSLQTLVDMSKNKRVAQEIRILVIGVDFLNMGELWCRQYQDSATTGPDEAEEYFRYLAELDEMKYARKHISLLCDALPNLVNCNKIRVADKPAKSPLGAEVRSMGTKTFHNDTGVFPISELNHDHGQQRMAFIMNTILAVMTRTKEKTKIKYLEIWPTLTLVNVPLRAFNCSAMDISDPNNQFPSMRHLELALGVGRGWSYNTIGNNINQLGRFLQRMPNLTYLKLHFRREPDVRVLLDNLSLNPNLPTLRSLHISAFDTSENSLVRFIQRFPHVTWLFLRKIDLTDGSWGFVFNKIQTALPKITDIAVQLLSVNSQPVIFKEQEARRDGVVDVTGGFECKGFSAAFTRETLANLGERIMVVT